jgi:hypothetical protein
MDTLDINLNMMITDIFHIQKTSNPDEIAAMKTVRVNTDTRFDGIFMNMETYMEGVLHNQVQKEVVMAALSKIPNIQTVSDRKWKVGNILHDTNTNYSDHVYNILKQAGNRIFFFGNTPNLTKLPFHDDLIENCNITYNPYCASFTYRDLVIYTFDIFHVPMLEHNIYLCFDEKMATITLPEVGYYQYEHNSSEAKRSAKMLYQCTFDQPLTAFIVE